MIALSEPIAEGDVLYEQVLLCPATFDVEAGIVTGLVALISTSSPEKAPITGNFTINTVTAELVLDCPPLSDGRMQVIGLDAAEVDSVKALINDAQATLEAAFQDLRT